MIQSGKNKDFGNVKQMVARKEFAFRFFNLHDEEHETACCRTDFFKKNTCCKIFFGCFIYLSYFKNIFAIY
jgi:hypothetical protein